MKRVNKKWQRGQERIVVGGSRRTAEFQTANEERRDGARWGRLVEGVGKMCV